MKFMRQIDSHLVAVVLVVFTLLFTAFDVLRKTMFREAAWNYQYPDWALIYNPFAIVLLLLLVSLLMYNYGKISTVEYRHFIIVLVFCTVGFSTLAFFITPIKSTKWALTPHVRGPVETFQYYPSTIAAEEGLKTFFSTFHSAPTLDGGDRIETTRYLTEQLRNTTYIPWNNLLADYTSNIITQRHGPIPGLLVAPFLIILGTSPTSAVLGSYALTLSLPIISYGIFRQYFAEQQARLGAILVLISPAYLIYQRYGTVSYDAITAVITAVAVLIFLRACRTDNQPLIVLSGVVFSGAMLSKISILTMFPAFAIIIYIYSDTMQESIKSSIIFGGSSLIIPSALLLVGYNFVAQYLYDIARIQMSVGGSSGLFGWLVAIYNVRYLGIVVLGFALSFALSVGSNLPNIPASKRDQVAIGFIPAMLPFGLFSGITLSRHLLPLLPLFVFIALCGIDQYSSRQLNQREIAAIVISTIILGLVNF